MANRQKKKFTTPEFEGYPRKAVECEDGKTAEERGRNYAQLMLKKWCGRRLHWLYTSASEVVREALRSVVAVGTTESPQALVDTLSQGDQHSPSS